MTYRTCLADFVTGGRIDIRPKRKDDPTDLLGGKNALSENLEKRIVLLKREKTAVESAALQLRMQLRRRRDGAADGKGQPMAKGIRMARTGFESLLQDKLHACRLRTPTPRRQSTKPQ